MSENKRTTLVELPSGYCGPRSADADRRVFTQSKLWFTGEDGEPAQVHRVSVTAYYDIKWGLGLIEIYRGYKANPQHEEFTVVEDQAFVVAGFACEPQAAVQREAIACFDDAIEAQLRFEPEGRP